jgi:hypothetical protein
MSSYGVVPGDLDRLLSPNRRIELTDSETAPTGTENTAITQAAIDNAEVKFHQAAGVYYAIPIAARPDATSFEVTELQKMVKNIVEDIAAYDLVARKPENMENAIEGSGYWAGIDKKSQRFLEGLQSKDRSRKLPAAMQRTYATVTTGGASTLDLPCSDFDHYNTREF